MSANTFRLYALSALVACCNCLLHAQPSLEWQKTYGGSSLDEFRSIVPTLDTGYIAVGSPVSADGDITDARGSIDFWVAKLTQHGEKIWAKSYGGSAYDWPYAIRQTSDGGYVVAGFTQSDDQDVVGLHGDSDAWILKLGSNGELEWQRTIGGSGRDEAYAIEAITDGGYIFAGRSNSLDGDLNIPGKGGADYWVVKLDMQGNIQWQSRYGGSSGDIARAIKATSDGGYIVVGESSSSDGDVTGAAGGGDFWVLKLENTGAISWQKAFGSIGIDAARSVHEIPGGYLVCGYGGPIQGMGSGWHGDFDIWVLRLDLTGSLVWAKALGGSEADTAFDCLVEPDGSILVAGSTRSKDGDVTGNNGIIVVWAVKLNDQGKLLWQKTVGGTDGETVYTACKAHGEGYVLGGLSWSTDGDLTGVGNKGESDAWVFKLSELQSATTGTPQLLLEAYPNPATNTLFLNTAAYEEQLWASVSDLSGKILLSQEVNPFDGLDVSSLPPGAYLLSATGATGNRYAGKFVKH